MTSEEFLKQCKEKHPEDYGICAPPTEAQFGLDILIEHFLGENWYSTMPVNTEQVNTEAIYEILEKYPKKASFRKRFCMWLKKITA